MNDRIGSAGWYKAAHDGDWRSCHLLTWSTDYEELRDGVGQYPAAIVEDNLTGCVTSVPACSVRFRHPE